MVRTYESVSSIKTAQNFTNNIENQVDFVAVHDTPQTKLKQKILEALNKSQQMS